MRTSMTSVSRAPAISSSDRPTHDDLASATSMRRKSERTPMAFSATFCAPDRNRARICGSTTAARRPASSMSRTSFQPGNVRNRLLARIRIRSGRVSAITCAPRRAARSDAWSCCS